MLQFYRNIAEMAVHAQAVDTRLLTPSLGMVPAPPSSEQAVSTYGQCFAGLSALTELHLPFIRERCLKVSSIYMC